MNLTRIKYSSVDQDLMARVRAFNPRSHTGDIIAACVGYLPDELAVELIDTLCGIVTCETSLSGVIYRGQNVGDPTCVHDHLQTGVDSAECWKCGERFLIEDHGLLSHHVVTDAGVKNIVDVWNSAGTAFTSMKFVGIGTGTTAEATTDTTLVTELTTEYNPNSTRATGTITAPSNNIARVVATNTLDSGTPAITEAGLFTQAATGGGILWDRFKFSAINLVGANADGIQTTINSTFTSGG